MGSDGFEGEFFGSFGIEEGFGGEGEAVGDCGLLVWLSDS